MKRALVREQSGEPLVSDGSCVFEFEDFYIYIIYTPNLGLRIADSIREREQGRFRGSSEGARGSIEGAAREQQESIEGTLWGSAGAQ